MFAQPVRWTAAALIAAAILPSPARAEVIDLTTYGSSGTAAGGLFYQANPQPTGTGYIDPFVRIQRTGTEAGYNTNGQIEFQTKDDGGHNWTHALPLNTLQAVTINGIQYYQFMLDINEKASDAGRLLSLNEVQIYLGKTGDLTGFTEDVGFGGTKSVKVYDLDKNSDVTVELDYKLNSGSGSGDMYMYIPVSLFTKYDITKYGYVYLYSEFGCPNGSDAGFEEWAALKGGTPPVNGVPAPPGLVLAGMGISGLLLGRLRFRRNVQA